jgi:tight adherence protein B
MKLFVILCFYIFSFLLILWFMYFFKLLDRRMEKRISYYFDIDKNLKKLRRKRITLKEGKGSLKVFNEIIRNRLSSINQEKIDYMLKVSGVRLSSEEYIMLKWSLVAILGGGLYFLFNNLIFLFLGGIFGYILPKVWINKKIRIRMKSFNEGLPDMISIIIGSLRSGYSFTQALKTVEEECESPIKEEIALLLKEQSYGVSMEEALNNLGKRMPSGDLDLLIQSVLIQRQVGGNLAGILETIALTIRERTKIERMVQTLTAQGRISGRVVGGLPIALGFAIYGIDPGYMTVLFTNKVGIILVSAGVISGLIGFILINKLTKVEV